MKTKSSASVGVVSWLLLARIALVSPDDATAQSLPPAINMADVAIIELWNSQTGEHLPVGSGVAFDRDGYVLTAKHVLSSFNPTSQEIEIRFGARSALPIKVQSYTCPSGDPDNGGVDICIFKVSGSDLAVAGVTSFPAISCRKLNQDEQIFGRGWPGDPRLEWEKADGTISSGLTAFDEYPTTAPALAGMSGGPFYDQAGAVVGLIKGGIGNAEKRTLLAPLFGVQPLIEQTGTQCGTAPSLTPTASASEPPSGIKVTKTYRTFALQDGYMKGVDEISAEEAAHLAKSYEFLFHNGSDRPSEVRSRNGSGVCSEGGFIGAAGDRFSGACSVARACTVKFNYDDSGAVTHKRIYDQFDNVLEDLQYPTPLLGEFFAVFPCDRGRSGIREIQYRLLEPGPYKGLDKVALFLDKDHQPRPNDEESFGWRFKVPC